MVKYPTIKVKLTGTDGNAFAIMANVIRAMKTTKLDPAIIAEYRKEATSGDYYNVIATSMKWVNVS